MEYYAVINVEYDDFTSSRKHLIEAENDKSAYKEAIRLTRITARNNGHSRLASITKDRKELTFDSRKVSEISGLQHMSLMFN